MNLLLSPAQLIDNLLKNASYSLRVQVLCRAKAAREKELKLLADMRLATIEAGWEDYWKEQHIRTSEALAAIERALATC
jgi:hypothetical protein